MRCLLSTTFTSSSEGLYSSPHLNTHKVGFQNTCQVFGFTCDTSEAGSTYVTIFALCCHCLPSKLSSPDSEGVFGRVPQSILDDQSTHLIAAHENSQDLQNLHRVSENAYKQYLKSRPNPSPESIRRVKSTDVSSMAVHPLLGLS